MIIMIVLNDDDDEGEEKVQCRLIHENHLLYKIDLQWVCVLNSCTHPVLYDLYIQCFIPVYWFAV